jgi:small neutral amino acid transporter SnatA (MarC family)
MSLAFLVVAFAATVNPCGTRLAYGGPLATVALGCAVALAAVAALAAAGGALLDAIDVSPESFRLAAGLVLAVEGARTLVWPRRGAEPALRGLGAAIVPVAFPLLLQPGTVALALTAGGDGVEAKAIAAFAVAAAGVAALAGVVRSDGLLVAGSRLLGALGVAAGVALAVDAIRDV